MGALDIGALKMSPKKIEPDCGKLVDGAWDDSFPPCFLFRKKNYDAQ
jgi:hypothetical protein